MIKKIKIDSADEELIIAAHREFEKKLSKDWHGVAAAIRLASGRIVTSLVLEAENPSLTICAEPIAIGKTLDAIESDPIVTIVAVRNRESTTHKVIPPCGRCREFITDYSEDAHVIIYDDVDGVLYKVKATDLLPYKYKSLP
jgi:cytidine deaminase